MQSNADPKINLSDLLFFATTARCLLFVSLAVSCEVPQQTKCSIAPINVAPEGHLSGVHATVACELA